MQKLKAESKPKARFVKVSLRRGEREKKNLGNRSAECQQRIVQKEGSFFHLFILGEGTYKSCFIFFSTHIHRVSHTHITNAQQLAKQIGKNRQHHKAETPAKKESCLGPALGNTLLGFCSFLFSLFFYFKRERNRKISINLLSWI